jgi:hypothetical protein
MRPSFAGAAKATARCKPPPPCRHSSSVHCACSASMARSSALEPESTRARSASDKSSVSRVPYPMKAGPPTLTASRGRWRERAPTRPPLPQRRLDGVLREVHAHPRGRDERGLRGVEAGLRQSTPPAVARLEIDRHELQERRDAKAQLAQALALPGLRPRLIDLEHAQRCAELGPTLGERVESGAEDHVLRHASSHALGEQIIALGAFRRAGHRSAPMSPTRARRGWR